MPGRPPLTNAEAEPAPDPAAEAEPAPDSAVDPPSGQRPGADRRLRRAALIATAVAVPVGVLAALLLHPLIDSAGTPAASAPSSAVRAELPPLDVQTPPVTAQADALCPGLMGGLPLTLSDSPARPVRSQTSYAAAWGDPPIVLRCGVDRPAGFAADSSLLQINGVAWFTQPGGQDTVWTAVDRGIYVEVSVPTAQASAPVAVLSTVIADRLPVQPLQPG